MQEQPKKTKFCVNCGAEIDYLAEICPKCGVRQPAIVSIPTQEPQQQQLRRTKYCVNCGAEIDYFAEICPKCGVRQPKVANASSSGKSRIAAGLFAIFLGGLGIHKFYLGDVVWGIVYLLLTWTIIPWIVGIIEGILYLTMSDEEFAAKYGSKVK